MIPVIGRDVEMTSLLILALERRGLMKCRVKLARIPHGYIPSNYRGCCKGIFGGLRIMEQRLAFEQNSPASAFFERIRDFHRKRSIHHQVLTNIYGGK